MDTLRFKQICDSVKFGGIPKFDHEEFTKEQGKELEDLLKDRSKNSLDAVKLIKVSKSTSVTTKQETPTPNQEDKS